mgnify:CR=1 FL=1
MKKIQLLAGVILVLMFFVVGCDDDTNNNANNNQNPQLTASCGTMMEGAMPAVRLEGFAELIGAGTSSFADFHSICETNYQAPLESLATWLVQRMESAAQ